MIADLAAHPQPDRSDMTAFTAPSMLDPITISAVQAQVVHAAVKHGVANTPLNPAMDDATKLVVLVEEVGEVARAMTYDNGSRDQLVKELLQVAAVAAMWAESLDAS